MITIRKVRIDQYRSFVLECLDYFSDYNGDLIFDSDTEFFIVNNNIKDVGLFTVSVSANGKEITPTFWAHPRVCKMGLLTIQKAAAMHCYARAYKENINYIMFRFRDALSSRTIRRLCPGVVEHLIDVNYYLCVCKLSDIKCNYEVDENYCFSLDI